MIATLFLPVLLSWLVLGAHFLRTGQLLLTAVCLVLPVLYWIRNPYSGRFLQVALLAGTAEWIRTTISFVSFRQDAGEDWTRMAVILGFVAAFTLGTALLIQTTRLQRWFGMGSSGNR